MIEFEVKYKVNNIERIEQRLKELNAEYLGDEYEEDYYFQHPCRDFMKTDEALRVRKTENKVELTYKGPKLSKRTKTRVEINVIVDSLQSILRLLEKLGFKKIFVVKKNRRKYKVSNEIEVSLDSVEGLGTFVEIEIARKEGEIKQVESELFSIAEILGLKGKPIIKSYLELLLEKDRSSGVRIE